MMNNLKFFRSKLCMTQAIFAEYLGIPYIDGPMISRLESGVVLPSPKDAQTIAEKLGTTIAQIWPEYPGCGPLHSGPLEKRASAFANGHRTKNYEVVTRYIPVGRKNAVRYPYLMEKTGLSERRIRELLLEARTAGEPIANLNDGSGFYYIADREDAARYYHHIYKIALSYLRQLWPLRKIMGGVEGQIGFGFCLRCGEEAGDALYCESCEAKMNDRAAGANSDAGQQEN